MYATNKWGEWTNETIDGNTSISGSPSMAIDSQNHIHISYRDQNNTALKYITNSSGFWDSKTIDEEAWGSYSDSIAVDSSDNIHISYYDSLRGDLKYATNESGEWINEIVVYNGRVGDYSSIAIDSEDKVHIIYFARENWVLNHAISVYDNDGDGAYDFEDCDDDDPNSYPNAAEICDGKDNDCDGAMPLDEIDYDDDGYMICEGDCADLDSNINPDAYEIPGNWTDENCDSYLMCDPNISWKNHGKFVSCVSDEVESLVTKDILTDEEGDLIIKNSAQSDIGKKKK